MLENYCFGGELWKLKEKSLKEWLKIERIES